MNCYAALYLIPDPYAAFDEMLRVLRPGGRIAVMTSRESPYAWFRPTQAAALGASGLRMFGTDEFTPAQARHGRGSRRATRRPRGPPHQARLWLARGRASSWSRWRDRSFCRWHRRARRKPRKGVVGTLRRATAANIPISRPRSSKCSPASCRTAGTGAFPALRLTPKASPAADASAKVLNALAQNIPWFLGGSADLGPSSKTALTFEGAGDFEAGISGRPQPPFRDPRTCHGGDRERPVAFEDSAFGSTFFIFSDYARAAIRLSALMELPAIFIFTHDAMGDGEDGPTHQPVEQLASLRAIPGLVTLRPGTPTRSWRLTAMSCSCVTSLRCWCCPASPCRLSIAVSTPLRRAWRAALMCSPTPRAGIRR